MIEKDYELENRIYDIEVNVKSKEKIISELQLEVSCLKEEMSNAKSTILEMTDIIQKLDERVKRWPFVSNRENSR